MKYNKFHLYQTLIYGLLLFMILALFNTLLKHDSDLICVKLLVVLCLVDEYLMMREAKWIL